MDDVVDSLRAVLPPASLLTEPADLDRYRHDDAGWAGSARPAAVVLAASLDDVVAAVKVAARLGAPVVPRGAGTGLSGGADDGHAANMEQPKAFNRAVLEWLADR